MYFSNLVNLSNYIKRTHISFADGFISDTLEVLSRLNEMISEHKGVCGASYNAVTLIGELDTEIEINKLRDGRWTLNERVLSK